MKTLTTILIMLLITVSGVNAQSTLVFKFGDTLTGKITRIDETTITLRKDNKEFKFLKTDLDSYTDNRDNERIRMAGKELISTSRNYITGFAVTVAGAGVIVYSSTIKSKSIRESDITKSNNTRNLITIGGGVIALIGVVMQVEAFTHLTDAGFILSEYGFGVKIKL
jgi:hypothetical protein